MNTRYLTIALAAAALATGCTAQSPADELAPSGNDTGALLDTLRVAPEGSESGYDRDEFDHWIAAPGGENCNTREVVLRRSGTGVRVDGACEAVAGHWTSAYTGERITDPSDLDIDHVVPLAEAWRSGAADWSDERREQFANDLQAPQLVAVDASSNRSKGDKDPAEWMPEQNPCGYARDWVEVKSVYGLTLDPQEKTALITTLGVCGK